VSLHGQDGEGLLTVLGDDEGRYSLRAPAPGVYRLRAERIGYHPQEKGPFTLQATDTLTVDFQLHPAPLLLDSILISVRRRAQPLREGEQLVYGRLLDNETGEAIPQGLVRLQRGSESAAAILSDDEGFFWLVSPSAGTYRLHAERIGYRASTGPELFLMPGDSIGVDFYLSVEAVLLNPIVVRATARNLDDRYDVSNMEALYRRYARWATSGFGDFLTRDSLAKYEDQGIATNVLMLMKMPRVNQFHVVSGGVTVGRSCYPDYYLNGFPWPAGVPIWSFTPDMLEAIEVYEWPEVPPELHIPGPGGNYSCGIVAYWTRQAPDPRPGMPTWKKVLAGAGFLGLGLFLSLI
jgi:hypothetical protein